MPRKAKNTIGGATAVTGGQTASKTNAPETQSTNNEPSTKVATNDAKAQAEVVFTDEDKKKLEQCELTIKDNLSGFLKIGEALKIIKKCDLQKIIDAKLIFDDYCERRGFGKTYGYRMMNAFECVEHLKATLGPNGVTLFPTNEAQVRPLTKLEPAEQVKIWSAVLKKAAGGTITAAMVEELAGGGSSSKTNDTPAAKADAKSAKDQAKKARAEHRALVAIGKLVEKAKLIDTAELNLKKLKDILDKIEALLPKSEDN